MSSPVTHLRLEPLDGSAPMEYKIEDETVEVRTLDPHAVDHWHTLSSNDLRTHVERRTVVAEWLQHRLGWRRLLQKCVNEEDSRDRAA